jgi:hypothetical protein
MAAYLRGTLGAHADYSKCSASRGGVPLPGGEGRRGTFCTARVGRAERRREPRATSASCTRVPELRDRCSKGRVAERLDHPRCAQVRSRGPMKNWRQNWRQRAASPELIAAQLTEPKRESMARREGLEPPTLRFEA